MAAAVEFDLLLQGDELRDVAGGLGFVERGEGPVQVCDVGLVVLLVVDLHDLGGDGRFEGLFWLDLEWTGETHNKNVNTYIVGVGKGRERELVHHFDGCWWSGCIDGFSYDRGRWIE